MYEALGKQDSSDDIIKELARVLTQTRHSSTVCLEWTHVSGLAQGGREVEGEHQMFSMEREEGKIKRETMVKE